LGARLHSTHLIQGRYPGLRLSRSTRTCSSRITTRVRVKRQRDHRVPFPPSPRLPRKSIAVNYGLTVRGLPLCMVTCRLLFPWLKYFRQCYRSRCRFSSSSDNLFYPCVFPLFSPPITVLRPTQERLTRSLLRTGEDVLFTSREGGISGLLPVPPFPIVYSSNFSSARLSLFFPSLFFFFPPLPFPYSEYSFFPPSSQLLLSPPSHSSPPTSPPLPPRLLDPTPSFLVTPPPLHTYSTLFPPPLPFTLCPPPSFPSPYAPPIDNCSLFPPYPSVVLENCLHFSTRLLAVPRENTYS